MLHRSLRLSSCAARKAKKAASALILVSVVKLGGGAARRTSGNTGSQRSARTNPSLDLDRTEILKILEELWEHGLGRYALVCYVQSNYAYVDS